MTYAINLTPQHASAKSFYGKAKVSMEDGKQVLYSYGTKVAEIENGRARVFGLYSQTTTRHIKEFLIQNGLKAENSKQIMKDYGSDKSDSYAIKTKSDVPTATISNMGDVRVFRINDKMQIYAHAERTTNGFKHIAVLMIDGQEVDKSTAHYLNRTWESYEYESVIHDLINKSTYISPDEKEKLKKIFAEESHKKIEGEFKTIGTIAQLGNVFAQTKKEKNEWKLRMIKAGLGNKGFELPENWDSLSEDEKEKRLDMIIKFLQKEK